MKTETWCLNVVLYLVEMHCFLFA